VLDLQVTRRLGGFTLEVGMSVGDHSVMVVVGESGSGKTTLLRLLAGLAHPDRGRIVVDDATWFDREAGRVLPASERPVGYVAQDYALFPHLTAAENVAFGLRATGIAARDIPPRVAAALERLRIGALAQRRPHELSGGQQQRVGIARALVTEPALILADEPTGNLDSHSGAEVLELFRDLHAIGRTIVLITHDAEVAAAADRAVHLRDGQLGEMVPA
jgi:ABC-type sulfate/molybdate transport systems ATPase subunit